MSTVLTFYGTERSDTDTVELTAYINVNNEISIAMTEHDLHLVIDMDKDTTEALIAQLVEQMKLMD